MCARKNVTTMFEITDVVVNSNLIADNNNFIE